MSYDHSVLYTTAQLTEGRSAWSTQAAGKEKNASIQLRLIADHDMLIVGRSARDLLRKKIAL